MHVSTVSRVLNGAGGVSIRPETRKRIVETARRLRYRPHAIARGLRLAATGTLGLLVPTLRNPLWGEIVHGAFERAWRRGYVVLLAEDTGDASAQAAYERLVDEGRIDGLMVLSGRAAGPLLERLATDGVPVVFADRGLPGSGRNVLMDEAAAVRVVLEHLASLGRGVVGHVEGPLEIDTTQRRLQAVESISRELGLGWLVEHATHDERGGFEAAKRLLGAAERPTACVVSSINQVVGAAAAARRLGVSVPAEVYVVTYDDDTILDYLDVPVTGVRMPLAALGAVAVDALIDQIEGKTPRDVVIETLPELVVRGAPGP